MDIQKLQQQFHINAQDIALVQQYAEQVRKELPEIVLPTAHAILTAVGGNAQPSQAEIAAMQQQSIKTWELFLRADFSDTYLENRNQTGMNLSQRGITPMSYFALTSMTMESFNEAFKRVGCYTADFLVSFIKLFRLDAALMLESYTNITQRILQEQNMSMSTPVAELWEGILFLPLVGIIDSKRAQEVMSTMLKKISESQSKVFILDISGVAIIDTSVANHLIKVTKATKLMGCECIISGISPAVAQTMVELGIQIEEVNTTGSMKDALQEAMQLVNVKIMKNGV